MLKIRLLVIASWCCWIMHPPTGPSVDFQEYFGLMPSSHAKLTGCCASRLVGGFYGFEDLQAGGDGAELPCPKRERKRLREKEIEDKKVCAAGGSLEVTYLAVQVGRWVGRQVGREVGRELVCNCYRPALP